MFVAYPEFTPLNQEHCAMKGLKRVEIDVQGVMLNIILGKLHQKLVTQ